MTTTSAIQILTEYAAWRRGAETDMLDPVVVREAIDKAIEVMRSTDPPICGRCGSEDVLVTVWCNKCNMTI